MIRDHQRPAVWILAGLPQYQILVFGTLLSSICLAFGFVARSPSARGCGESGESEREQVEATCHELQELGADCEYSFVKNPRVEIRLGDRWRGDGNGLSLLSRLPRLDEMTWEGTAVTQDAASYAASFPMLSILRVRRTTLPQEVAATFVRGKEIYGLELQEVTLDSQVWKQIYRLNLLWLAVESCTSVLSNDGLGEGQLDRLMTLHLSGPEVNDNGLRNASGLHSLRQIIVRQATITSAGLGHLNRLTCLTNIDLTQTRVEDLSQLDAACLGNLRELVLDGTLAADQSLVALSRFTTLESLSLNNTAVSDPGVEHLAVLVNLRHISLQGTSTTDASLRRLSAIRTLITAIDSKGDVILFRRAWLETPCGNGLPAWAGSRKKNLYVWTDTGRELLTSPSDSSRKHE